MKEVPRMNTIEDRSLRKFGTVCGIVGPLLLTLYFVTPAFVSWPSVGTPPDQLVQFAKTHEALFYLGAWLQCTGALLSVVFFLVLVQLAGAQRHLAGLFTIVAVALLLAVVVVEAAMLVAVPFGAANNDTAMVMTTFALSNGVFVRVFALAPAPAVFAGLAAVLFRSRVLPMGFAWAALVVAALFELAGIASIVSSGGLILAIVMSVAQELWIVAAAVGLGVAARVAVIPAEDRSAITDSVPHSALHV
jgi:hypothetical protein